GEAVGVVVAPLAVAEDGDADGAAVPVHAGADVGAVVAARPTAAGGVGGRGTAQVGGAQVRLDDGAADAPPAGVAVGRVVLDAGADGLVQVVLLDVGQDEDGPVGSEVLVVVGDVADGGVFQRAGRQLADGVLVAVAGQADLLHVVRAAHAGGGF